MSSPPYPPLNDAELRFLRVLAIRVSAETQDPTIERLTKRAIVDLRRARRENTDQKLVIERLRAELARDTLEIERLRLLSQRRA